MLSRATMCAFRRGKHQCKEQAEALSSLCNFHGKRGGATLNENVFYSVSEGTFKNTRTAVPEPGDIRGDAPECMFLYGGNNGKFSRLCKVCWALRRTKSEFCIRHQKPVGTSAPSADTQYPCQFFDIVSAQMGWNIVHRHTRADGVSVGEEFRVKNFSVDGYVPEHKIILEFLGDFYHGNPAKYDPNAINPTRRTTFGELYTNTYERHKTIASSGYRVYYIWESEFLKNRSHPRLFDVMHRWDDWEPLEQPAKRVRQEEAVMRL